MALILAIEPDERQAAQLTDVISRRVSAELVLAESTERALIAIGDRVPDLILIPMLLSPQEDAALAGALRAIAAAGRVQMLTIPVLAEAAKPPKKRGVLAQFRRSRAASAHPDGCDPSVFGDQIAAYLAEAALARAQEAPTDVTALDAPIEDIVPAVAAAAGAEVESVAAIAAPAIDETTHPADVRSIHEAIVAPIEEQIAAPIEERLAAAPDEQSVGRFVEQVAAPLQEHVVAPFDERFAAVIDEPLIVLPVEPAIETLIIPLVDSVLPMESPVLATEEPIAEAIGQPATMAAETVIAATDHPAPVVIDQSTAHAREEAADFHDYDPIAIQIEQSLRLPIAQPIIGADEEPLASLIDEYAAPEPEEPAVYELSLDEWSNDAASMMAINAMMLPVDQPSMPVGLVFEPPVAVPEAVDVVEPIAADQIFVIIEPEVLAEAEPVAAVIEPPVAATMQSVAEIGESAMLAAVEPVLVVSEPLAVAAEGPVTTVEQPVAQTTELVDVVSAPTLLAAVEPIERVTEPPVLAAVEPVVQAVDTRVVAAIEPVAPIIESTVLAAEPATVVSEPPVMTAAAQPVEPVAVVSDPPRSATESAVVVAAAQPVAASVPAVLDEDPGFFGGGAVELPEAPPAPPPAVAAAPVKAKRHEWVELVESLRLDLERRRVERAAQDADTTNAPVREPAAPAVTTARVLTMEPKKARRPAPPVRTKTRKKPVQNEWGLFDPDQCGFAALLAKLDEITHAK